MKKTAGTIDVTGLQEMFRRARLHLNLRESYRRLADRPRRIRCRETEGVARSQPAIATVVWWQRRACMALRRRGGGGRGALQGFTTCPRRASMRRFLDPISVGWTAVCMRQPLGAYFDTMRDPSHDASAQMKIEGQGAPAAPADAAPAQKKLHDDDHVRHTCNGPSRAEHKATRDHRGRNRGRCERHAHFLTGPARWQRAAALGCSPV